jgi:hypothetical protein
VSYQREAGPYFLGSSPPAHAMNSQRPPSFTRTSV